MRCVLAIDKPTFGNILEFAAYPFVSPANVKEASAMDPPDGPLAPLPGAEALFRILHQSQSRRSDIEGIYSADS